MDGTVLLQWFGFRDISWCLLNRLWFLRFLRVLHIIIKNWTTITFDDSKTELFAGYAVHMGQCQNLQDALRIINLTFHVIKFTDWLTIFQEFPFLKTSVFLNHINSVEGHTVVSTNLALRVVIAYN